MEIDHIGSLFRFEGLVRHAILQFKYYQFTALASSLASLMAEYVRARSLSVEVLLPVPLHPRRLRSRGYNQSSLLAKELGRLVDLPVEENCLRRVNNTPPQAKADAETRRNNVAGAFSCCGGQVRGRRFLLVDDVCTTGATLNACAIALKETGANWVSGLTLAREV